MTIIPKPRNIDVIKTLNKSTLSMAEIKLLFGKYITPPLATSRYNVYNAKPTIAKAIAV